MSVCAADPVLAFPLTNPRSFSLLVCGIGYLETLRAEIAAWWEDLTTRHCGVELRMMIEDAHHMM